MYILGVDRRFFQQGAIQSCATKDTLDAISYFRPKALLSIAIRTGLTTSCEPPISG